MVDGEEIEERTPVRLTALAPGSHTLQVENGARYRQYQTQVEVQRGQVLELPRVRLELVRVTVSFTSEPAGAAVTLVHGRARRSVGTTPTSADLDLDETAWSAEMALAGYEPWSRAVEPLPGQEELEVRAELARRAIATGPRPHPVGPRRNPPDTGNNPPPSGGGPGTLRVQTVPWSQVFVDGQLIGNTPQTNISLPAGSHRVTLVNPDFNIRENVNVTIEAGGVETLRRTLSPGN